MIQQSSFQWDGYRWVMEDAELPFLAKPLTLEIYSHCEYQEAISSPDQIRRPTDRQIAIANTLLSLPDDLRPSMHDVAEMARAEHDDEVSLSNYDLGHINRDNIGKHYRVVSAIIPGDCEPDDYHVLFDANCRWEQEHGLRLSMVNGRFVGYSCQSGAVGVRRISKNAIV